jgi:MOSC domain-containing protein YiiM
MFEGSVVSIHIADGPGTEMLSVPQAQAVPGKGLEGDRYFKNEGTFSKPQPDRELTLIEIEAVTGFTNETGIEFLPGNARRNIVTRDVPLNHLVGREFRVGEVRVRGLKLCEPCGHLAKLSHEGVLPGLVHRGGLRAQILNEGVIRPGDSIRQICEERS